MNWNYRVIRKVDDEEEYFEIQEVYYDENGVAIFAPKEGRIPFGFTLNELEEDLKRFLDACEKPILNYVDF